LSKKDILLINSPNLPRWGKGLKLGFIQWDGPKTEKPGATVNQHTTKDEWLVVRKQFSVGFQFNHG